MNVVRITGIIGSSFLCKGRYKFLEVIGSNVMENFVTYYKFVLVAATFKGLPPQVDKNFLYAAEFCSTCHYSSSYSMD